MDRRKWQTSRPSFHGDGDLLQTVCRLAYTVSVEVPEIMAARRQEKKTEKDTESQVTITCGNLWTKRRCLRLQR